MIRFPCLSCGKKLKAPREKVGAKTKCPRCSGPVTVPNEPPILFPCTSCGKLLQSVASHAGRRFDCPFCKIRVQVPEDILEVVPADDPPPSQLAPTPLPILYRCPACSAEDERPGDHVGMETTCHRCGAVLRVPVAMSNSCPPSSARAELVRRPPRQTVFRCPACWHDCDRGDQREGQEYACPKCQAVLAVPTGAPPFSTPPWAALVKCPPTSREAKSPPPVLPPIKVDPGHRVEPDMFKALEEIQDLLAAHGLGDKVKIEVGSPRPQPPPPQQPPTQPPKPPHQWSYVAVSARQVNFPSLCACCLVYTTGVLFARHAGADGETKSWPVPYCSKCSEALKSTSAAVVYEGWHGTVHLFKLWNAEFAEAFRNANRGKLVYF